MLTRLNLETPPRDEGKALRALEDRLTEILLQLGFMGIEIVDIPAKHTYRPARIVVRKVKR